jgi:hypothetical protein
MMLMLLLTALTRALAQEAGGMATFSQAELEQLLGPIALYTAQLHACAHLLVF